MYKITLDKSRILKAFLLLIVMCLTAKSINAQQVTISGRVTTLNGGGLEDATVNLYDSNLNLFTTTLSDGTYQFTVPAGGTYTVKPFFDANPLNGVSTFDLVLLERHLSGEFPLLTPYQIIAADVNGSNSIDETDTIDVRKLILGIYTELPNIGSWRFVRADYVFPDPQNPFPFPESAILENVNGDVGDVDFIAIKAGDLNNSNTMGGDSVWSTQIIGKVRIDDNGNCISDLDEQPLEDWLVCVYGTNGTFYTSTTSAGNFVINVFPGIYDVRIIRPNGLWEACVDTIFGLQVNFNDLDTANFPVQPLAYCPYLEVDLSTPFLRRCFENIYTVRYCNKGTAAAENVYVEVEFDSLLSVVNSTVPWASVNGNIYTFDVGQLVAGDCGEIKIVTLVNCEAVLGQAHCSEARIFPDSSCVGQGLAWSGANLKVKGECYNGEVIFTITNTGEDMTEPIEYIVIEDIMIQMTGNSIFLASGASQTITIPANGSTWRLEMPQVTDNPFGGLISATVEGCGENGNGTFSLGFVSMFPQGDESPLIDVDCQENIGAFDPNDKQGIPLGVFDEHFIPEETEIEYLIRFQNTGTDTAFTVRILDTLSQWLDVATIRQTGSSHACTFKVLGPGVVQFLFPNIMLPDSNVNEAASHGYAKFAIRPKTGLSTPTLIENEAAIFFDFNDPVITNRTRHTLGEKYLDVSTVSFRPGIELSVYPNPVASTATFHFKSPLPLHGILRVFDLQGRQVKSRSFDSNIFDLDASGLLPGMYLFRVDSERQAIGSGKLVVKRK